MGKGNRDHTTDHKAFREGYDNIDWSVVAPVQRDRLEAAKKVAKAKAVNDSFQQAMADYMKPHDP